MSTTRDRRSGAWRRARHLARSERRQRGRVRRWAALQGRQRTREVQETIPRGFALTREQAYAVAPMDLLRRLLALRGPRIAMSHAMEALLRYLALLSPWPRCLYDVAAERFEIVVEWRHEWGDRFAVVREDGRVCVTGIMLPLQAVPFVEVPCG